MKKTLIKVLFILLIILLLNSLFLTTSKAFDKDEVIKREDVIETEQLSQEEYVIYKYDKKTDTTTIVDTDEMLSLCNLTSTNESQGYTPPYQLTKTNFNSLRNIPNFFFSPNLSLRPYSDNCKIIAEGGLNHGSGFLVGSNLLLTNAHCVFSDKTFENYYANWTCYPAYDNGPYSEGLFTGWDTVYYSSGYGSIFESVSDENDWALCVLQSNLGDSQGWFGCRSYGSNSYLEDKPVKQMGYPKNDGFDGKYQFYSIGNITDVRSKSFDADSINHAAMSGGPIVLQSDENYAVGLIKGRHEDNTTYGVRITSEIVDLINSLQ